MEIFKKIGTKEITLTTILSYVIGFIITNIYLANYGFSEFSFFHVKFIPIGFLFLFLTVFIFYLFRHVDNISLGWPWFLRIVLWCLFPLLLIFCLSIILINPIDSLTGRLNDLVIRLDYSSWITINLCLYFLISNSITKKIFLFESHKDFKKGSKITNIVLFSLILLILNVGLFANLIYPSIPSYLGGGGQISVSLKTKSMDVDKSMYAKIIYQTPDYVLFESLDISSEKLKTTMIPFSQIESIEYLGMDRGTGYNIFSKYKGRVDDFVYNQENI